MTINTVRMCSDYTELRSIREELADVVHNNTAGGADENCIDHHRCRVHPRAGRPCAGHDDQIRNEDERCGRENSLIHRLYWCGYRDTDIHAEQSRSSCADD